MAQASRIREEGWRKSFLENVPENAGTIALAEALCHPEKSARPSLAASS